MRKVLIRLFLVVALSFVMAPTASAVTVDGIVYTISFTTVDATAFIYDITLTINTSGSTLDQSLITSAGFKVAGPGSYTATEISASPGSWSFSPDGQVDSSGCASSPSAGFVCWGGSETIGGTFTFSAQLDLESAIGDSATIKATYDCAPSDDPCEGQSQVSEVTGFGGTGGTGGTGGEGGLGGIIETPEPGSIVLLGFGVIALGAATGLVRRRRNK